MGHRRDGLIRWLAVVLTALLLLAGRAMQNAWKSVKPQLAKLPPDTRAGAINQLTNTLTEIQTEAIKCL